MDESIAEVMLLIGLAVGLLALLPPPGT